MRLLTRTAQDLRRLWSPDLVFVVGMLSVLAALELLGRHTTTDLHDLLALFALGLLSVLVTIRHRRRPMPWVTTVAAGARRLGRALRGATFEIGIDLRGTPRVRRGSPPLVLALGLSLAVWALVAGWFAAAFPHQLRAVAVQFWYLGYLSLLALVWLFTATVTLLAFFIPAALIHDAFVGAHRGGGPRPRRREFWTVSGYLTLLVVFAYSLPVAVSLALCSVILIVYLVICWLPARSEVRFVWRPHESIRVGSMSWSRWVTYEFSLITLAVFALVLTTCGDRLGATAGALETMPVTAMLGVTLAWLAPGALSALLLQMVLGRLRDPARPARSSAHVIGAATREARSALRRAFRAHGWRVRFAPAAARALDVEVELVDRLLPVSPDSEPRWPLAVTLAELDDAGLWRRLARRDEIQKRRRLLSGLESLFKVVARRTRQGSGTWLAPHFWFFGGLVRDAQRDPDDEINFADERLLSPGSVGPPFHRVLPRTVRNHLYLVLRALQIDLIFVEDGVGWRRLRRVLRTLFEIYDIHGGRQAAEEIHFKGLPGTRILIHEFQFDDPFKSDVYPEPKYDFLGRARLLHVFRDRGEQEELIEPPFDATRTPAPLSLR